MCAVRSNPATRPSATVTDDGRALPLKWHIVYVRTNCERRVADFLSKEGLETYVAIQKEWHQWSDRRKLIDRIVIPLIVFVKCSLKDTEKIRRLSLVSYIMNVPGGTKLATVKDEEIDRLRFMLTNAETSVLFTSEDFKKGDAVRVRFGKLAGITGTVAYNKEHHSCIAITIDYLGCALVEVDAGDLMPLKE